ncbi:MAG UNVERIFIED_CONTAM: hypothetical protein LVR29_07615 [Microcystis novacekii LVE1205-3]|jgi:hypothetical protein
MVREKEQWSTVDKIGQTNVNAIFSGKQEIQEGWLKLSLKKSHLTLIVLIPKFIQNSPVNFLNQGVSIMSNTNDLVLHLKLDTIIPDADNQRVRSAFLSENVSASTESQYKIHGNPQVVPDEHFGSCFTFDGNNDFC